MTALVKAHEEELDYESKQTLGETGKGSYKGNQICYIYIYIDIHRAYFNY